MQLKSDKTSPKNVDFPRSETNQQTDMWKINIFLLILTAFFRFKTFIAILKKLKDGFGNEAGKWPGHPLGGAHRRPQEIEFSIFIESSWNVQIWNIEVKMSNKVLIFRIAGCWFVSEGGKSTFLGLILSDFSCILFGRLKWNYASILKISSAFHWC